MTKRRRRRRKSSEDEASLDDWATPSGDVLPQRPWHYYLGRTEFPGRNPPGELRKTIWFYLLIVMAMVIFFVLYVLTDAE